MIFKKNSRGGVVLWHNMLRQLSRVAERSFLTEPFTIMDFVYILGKKKKKRRYRISHFNVVFVKKNELKLGYLKEN